MKKILSLLLTLSLSLCSFNFVFANNAPSDNQEYPYVFDLKWQNQTAKWSKYGKVQSYEVMLCCEGRVGDVYQTTGLSYNFRGKILDGIHEYFFKVRAYNKNTGWTVWEQSPTIVFEKKANRQIETHYNTVNVINSIGDNRPSSTAYSGVTETQELFSNPSGVWEKVNGLWFFKIINGYYATNMWINSNGIWYYVNHLGVMITGLQNIDGKTYYFDETGAMKTGEVKIGTLNHYFGTDGAMIY